MTEQESAGVIPKTGSHGTERIWQVTDRLLDKLEQAIGELDMQMITQVQKEKTIEYAREDHPGKPVREVVSETQKLTRAEGLVDRGGLKQVAAVLKDIKEIRQIDLDLREQEARIARYQTDGSPREKDFGVVILPAIAEGDHG